MEYIWLFIWAFMAIALVILEIVTVALVSIWFAVGAFAAFLTAVFTDSFWIQLVVFAVVSALTLVCTRPFVKRFLRTRKTPTNADSLIGKECIVVETVGANASGRVRQGDVYWTATASDATECFVPGERVVIAAIVGNRLTVCQNKEVVS